MASQHPLQKLSSPSWGLSLAVHLLGIASFNYNFMFLQQWDVPIAKAYGWHFQFLTILGLAASMIAFMFGAAADVTKSRTLFQVKNYIAVLATPVEVVISILYWGIKFVDSKLLMPDEFYIDILPDVGFHLAPAVFLTIDLLFFSPPWTIPAYSMMALSTVFTFAYWFWVEHCYSHNGWYPYPLFELLTTGQRIAFFTFAAALIVASASGLKWLYGRVNGYETAQKEAHKPLKQVQ
ncbi:FAR-17a/AIG1-like protein [Fusarium flagelliforme]|uniref:Integral membrane protein n=1 Tax=Fusarium flagelliforme TaxID=2675880 RepID=A0A395N6U3_9HYPO|nr:FAR-17a/AIG1-like protein [Fusarium flagelliforme]KAH7196943.1 FAR-17a/AIG1-like protein [Fusarium flagelliforme]RFN55607.1 integral membrane protein [Fusarium flagelliforme]